MKFTGWVGEGRLPREPQPGESKIRGRNIAGIPVNQPGGGVSRFYILPGGDEGGAREKNSRVSASRLRSNKDANYCLARARRKRSSAAAPPKSGREFTFGMWSELKRICTYGVFYNRKYYGRFGEWGSRRKSKSNTGADGIIQTFAGTFYEYITRCVSCMKHFETWSTS